MRALFFILTLILIYPSPVFAKPKNDTTPYYEKQYERSSDSFKPLSPTKGWVYGLAPVNGLGIIYTGHPVVGGFMIGTEVIGMPFLIIGLQGVVGANDEQWFDFSKGFLTFGLITVGGTYLADAILTPILVKKYNRELNSIQSRRWEPYMAYDGNQFSSGVKINF